MVSTTRLEWLIYIKDIKENQVEYFKEYEIDFSDDNWEEKLKEDDCVEELWKEYVKFPDGSCADVVDSSEEWSFDNKNGIAPFYRGKNCY